MKLTTTLSLAVAIGMSATAGAGQNLPQASAPERPAAKPQSQVDSVIRLVKAGLPDDLIIQHLRETGFHDEISAADMLKMQKAKVPETVIAFMLDPAAAATPVAVAPQPPVEPQQVLANPSAALTSKDVTPVAPPPAAPPLHITLPAGTEIVVRTIDAIDSKKADLVKEYSASLDRALMLDGAQVVPGKATAFLKIDNIKQAGMIRGKTSLTLRLVAITVNGKRVELGTSETVSSSASKGKDSAIRAGSGAVGGGLVGAVAGGGIGAGVGAAIGSTVGLGSELVNHKVVKIAPETRLSFKLNQPVVIE